MKPCSIFTLIVEYRQNSLWHINAAWIGFLFSFSSPKLSNSFPGWQALELLDLLPTVRLLHLQLVRWALTNPSIHLGNLTPTFLTSKYPSSSHSSHIRLSQFFYAYVPLFFESICFIENPHTVQCLLPSDCDPPGGQRQHLLPLHV